MLSMIVIFPCPTHLLFEQIIVGLMPLVKRVQKKYFLIFQPKQLLRVLRRTTVGDQRNCCGCSKKLSQLDVSIISTLKFIIAGG